jgi:Secretion system C-terminal sorting domain/Pullulanase X25 domain
MKKLYTLLMALLLVGYVSAQNLVEFQVDMSNEGTISDTVSVAGDFQAADGNTVATDWTPGVTLLTDPDMDGIYTYTADLPNGTYAYKFINGTAWGQDEGVPSACAVGGNRQVVVAGASVIPVVCFAMCTTCPTIPDTVLVTFSVDMTREILLGNLADTVSVAGSFQSLDGNNPGASDWSPGQTILTDPDGDSIFEYIARLPIGTYAYKFVNGTMWGFEEPIPQACNVSGNREVIVAGDGDSTTVDNQMIPTVCYGRCTSSCPPVLPDIFVTFRVDASALIASGNLDPTGLFVSGAFENPAWQKDSLAMTLDVLTEIASVKVLIDPFEYEFRFYNGNCGDNCAETGTLTTCGQLNPFGDWNRILDLIGRVGDTVLPAFYFDSCSFSDNGRPSGILDNVKNDIRFGVYPNPFTDQTNIIISDKIGSEFNVYLRDVNGKVVKTFTNIRSQEKYTIDRGDLKPGMYLLIIEDENGRRSSKKLAIN